MKIQLSPTRIIKDALTVWNEHGPEVDLVLNLQKLTFAPGSIETIFAFHVLDHLFYKDAEEAMKNWHSCLQTGGQIYTVVDDFEHIARSLVGGDINIDMFNEQFSHPVQFTRDNLIRLYIGAGFKDGEVVIWNADVTNLFKKKVFELVFSSKKI